MVRSSKGFTLVEIMIVVAIIGILIAIAVPSFLRAREISRRNACQENLNKTQGAKEQWAIDNNVGAGAAAPAWSDLVGVTLFLRKEPGCPSSGVYAIGNLETNPTCTKSTQAAPYAHVLP